MALVLDASSPAMVFNGAGVTATTASFTPPAGSRLVAFSSLNSGGGNTPSAPSISGGSLTWTLLGHSARPDTPATDGQAAAWTALVGASASMTVTVTNADPATGQSIKVMVFTDNAGGTVGIGATKENGRATAGTSVADSVTATVTGSRGTLVYTDWNAVATVPTAGTGCTTTGGGAAQNSPNLTYATILRSTADGVAGNAIAMNLTTGSTSSNRWVIVEVTPAPSAQIPILVMAPPSGR